MNAGAIGWGDLLRMRHALPPEQWRDAAGALGFAAEVESTQPANRAPGLRPPKPLPEPPSRSPEPPLPSPAPLETGDRVAYWRLASDVADPQWTGEVPPWLTAMGSPGAEVFESGASAQSPGLPPPEVPPLVPPARLAACLRQWVTVSRCSGEPDVRRMVARLARGRALTRWPLQPHDRWPGRVCLVLDIQRSMWPLQEDLRRVAVQMESLLGERLQVLLSRGGPGTVCDLEGEPVDLPADGRTVVVLGDIGMGQPGGVLHRRWCAWGQRQARAGRRALLLVPTGRAWVTREAAASFDVVPLDDRGPLRRVPAVGVRTGSVAGVSAQGLDLLRAALFGNPCVSPGLLRELRCLLAAEGLALDVGSERALWQDAAISATAHACTVVQEQREAVEAGFCALPPGLQAAVAGLHWRHLQSASPLIRAEYARGVRPLLAWQESPVALALVEGEAAAEVLARQACVAMWQGKDEALASNLSGYLSRLGTRSLSQIQHGSAALQAAWVMAHREGLREGRLAVLEGVDAQAVGWVFAGVAPLPRLALTCWMDAPRRSMLRVEPEQGLAPTVARLAVTPGALEWRVDGQRLRAGEAVALSPGQRVHEVRCGGRVLQVESFERPAWAESIWFDQGEWYAALPGGRELIWTPATGFQLDADRLNTGQLPKACWWDVRDRASTQAETDLGWASATGTDEFGLWAEFTVRGKRGPVTQRLRWIAPGEFLMGSPDNEKGRYDNERQHSVLLTQGYWLADTACTQELWEAVMGENPSRFKDDPQNPVEQVSWNDITQKFLPRLNKLMPGLNLTLPTEAQWEYACRAGTTTPFSFGEQITPEQVNYDGNHPYNGGKKGEYRQKTVPVKALPENPWGLHQMHGNVWEWCINELTPYPENTVVDPVVNQEGHRWVLRGGGWFSAGKSCRSAYRPVYRPIDQRGHFGFRMAQGIAGQPDQFRQFEFRQPVGGSAQPKAGITLTHDSIQELATHDLAKKHKKPQPHNAAKKIIESLKKLIAAGTAHEIPEHVADKIVEAVNGSDVDVNYSSSAHAEVDQIEVHYRTHEYVRDKSGQPAVDFVGFEDGWLLLRFRLVVTYDVDVWFRMSVWDSVDREYVPIGNSSATTSDSVETEVTLSLAADFLNGIENVELGDINIDLNLPDVDVGNVEPDMHDD